MFAIAGKSIFEGTQEVQTGVLQRQEFPKEEPRFNERTASSKNKNLSAVASSNIQNQSEAQFENLPREVLEKIVSFTLNNYDTEKISERKKLFDTMLTVNKDVANIFREVVTTVEISRENMVLSDLLNMLYKYPRLKTLVLRGNIQKESTFLRWVNSSSSKNAVLSHKSLEVLEFKAGAVMAGRLRSLVFHHRPFKPAIIFNSIKKSGLSDLENCFPNVRKFKFENQFAMTDDVVIELAKKFPGMNSLSLDFSVELTDKSIVYLAEKCNFLTEISLTGCSKLTDKSIIYLSKNCKNLIDIKLNKCHLITNIAVVYLLKKCLRIGSVGLNQCLGIKPAVLIKFAQKNGKPVSCLKF